MLEKLDFKTLNFELFLQVKHMFESWVSFSLVQKQMQF